MDRKLVAILVGGALVMACTTWICFPKPPPPIDPVDRHFVHCNKCDREMPYLPERLEKPCMQCGATDTMFATKESLKKSGAPPNPYTPMGVALLAEANILLAAVLFYFHYRNKWIKEEEFLYADCDRCRQRLKYRADKVGEFGQCRRCKHRFVFPEAFVEENEAVGPWWQPRQWQRVFNKRWKSFRGSA